MLAILKNLPGLLVFVIGFITLLLSEYYYGSILCLLGLCLMPLAVTVVINSFGLRLEPRYTFFSIALLLILLCYSLVNHGNDAIRLNEDRSELAINRLSQHEIKHLQLNSIDQYFIEAGKGPETIFLLHGFPDMASTWDETITELSKTHRVIAPFLRGYYPSGMDDDYSVKTIAGDITELAKVLKVERYAILGQDWGASIAFATANLAPENVTKVIALAIPHPSTIIPTPSLLFAGRHFFVFSQKDWAIRYTQSGNYSYIDTLYQRWSPDFEDFQESSDAIKTTFKYPGRLEASLGYYLALFEDQANADKKIFYASLPKVPVLYLGGENDQGVTEEITDAMEQTMPMGSKVVVFKKAGHFLHREVFSDFIDELKAFL
ncbi:MAG: alpha/beta hydrolase [Arenicella sp.]|nr:alpha/beta hydrolase [Arenicella sp.]